MPRTLVTRLALASLLLAGCRGRNDLVEAELRSRDRELSETRAALTHAELLNEALTREMRERHGTCASPVASPIVRDGPAELIAGMVKEIVLGRQTGGVDDDRQPGDEALLVVATPRDADGSAIKAPGTMSVSAFEISAEGIKIPLSTWELSTLQLRPTWKSSLFATGYHMTLPWQNWPNSEKLRLVVRFTTLPDGRVFEADRDVTIRLGLRNGAPPIRIGPAVPTPVVAPSDNVPKPMGPPAVPAPPEVLPPPKPGAGPLLNPNARARPTVPAAILDIPYPASLPTVRLKPPILE
jgi:hypothetical protein